MSWDGLDAAALASLTAAPRVDLRDAVGSVLDVAHQMGAGGAPTGSFALADSQSAGRGRAGRTWHSPAGSGIWLAVLLRPAAAPHGGALAIRAGLCVLDALDACARNLDPRLKWPNDVMAAGRKAGGVLCEARWSGARLGWVAVGIGLNVRGPVDPAVRDLAIALEERAPGLSRTALLAELVPRVARLNDRPPALEPDERATFLRRAWPAGEEAVSGIEPDGALLVRLVSGAVERRTIPD